MNGNIFICTYFKLLGQFYQNQECNFTVCSIRSAEWQIARSAHLTAPATTEPASVNFYKFLVAPSWESRHGMWALSEVELASQFFNTLFKITEWMLVPSLSSPGSVVSSTHYHWLILPPLWPQVTASSGLELLPPTVPSTSLDRAAWAGTCELRTGHCETVWNWHNTSLPHPVRGQHPAGQGTLISFHIKISINDGKARVVLVVHYFQLTFASNFKFQLQFVPGLSLINLMGHQHYQRNF